MTRKHYEAIARALRQSRPRPYHSHEHRNQWNLDMLSVTKALRECNDNFQEALFKEACGGLTEHDVARQRI